MTKFSFHLVSSALQLFSITSVSGKLLPVSSKSLDVAGITARIISDCYRDQVKEIGLAGNFSDSFFSSIGLSDSPIGTVLLNHKRSSVQSDVVSVTSRHKLQIFVISSSSPQELEEILVDVRNSRWWNHVAKFFVFHADEGTGCSEASEYLWTSWTMDLLGAKFICTHADEGPLVYMFNPYTKYAPTPWEFERTEKGINDHPWTLFVRRYLGNMEICKNMDFDQSKDAGGYDVRMSTFDTFVLPDFEATGKFSNFGITNDQLKLITRHVNVKLKISSYPLNKTLGFVDKDGKGHGLMSDVIDGRSDVLFRSVPITTEPQLPGLYTYVSARFEAVTQYTGYPSQWQKVTSAIDFSSRIGLCIVALINMIFMKYAFRQSFVTAFLNTLRIICSSCLVKLPNNFASRIYLAGLFFFFINIQALYQGQLAARLTNHERYPNVNNKRDLMESDYILYGRDIDSVVFSEAAYRGRFVPLEKIFECPSHVLLNSSIACVSFKGLIINQTIESKLHMSKNFVAEFPVKFILRENWHLEEKFYRYTSQTIESGILDHRHEIVYNKQMRILEVNENGNNSESFKVLTLKDLDFVFVILAVGIGFSAIIFIIELSVRSNRSSRIKKRFHQRLHFGRR